MNACLMELTRKPPLVYFPPEPGSAGRAPIPGAPLRNRRDVLRMLVGSDSRRVRPPVKRRPK